MTVHSFSGCWLHSVLNDDTAWVSTDEMCINVNMMDVISDALGIGTIDCNCIVIFMEVTSIVCKANKRNTNHYHWLKPQLFTDGIP